MSINKITNIANNIVYLIFLIVIYKTVGTQGTGIFVLSFIFISFIYLLLFGGAKVTVAKLVSARLKRGFNDNAKKVFKYSLSFNLLISIVAALIIGVLANPICNILYKNTLCAGIILFLLPVFVIGVICETIKGYYTGCGSYAFVAISDIAKDILLVVGSPFVIKMIMSYGEKVAALKNDALITGVYGGIGVVLSLFISLFVSLIIIMVGIKGLIKQDNYSFNEVRSKDGLNTFLRAYIPACVRKVREVIFVILPAVFALVIYMRNNSAEFADILLGVACVLILLYTYFYYNLSNFDEYNMYQYSLIRSDYKKEDRKGVLIKYTSYAKSAITILIPTFVTFLTFSGFICNKLFEFSFESATKISILLCFVFLFAIVDRVFTTGLSAVNLDMTVFLGNAVAFVIEIIFVLAVSKSGFSISNIAVSLMLFFLSASVFHGVFAVRSVGFKYNDLVVKAIKVLIAAVPMLIIDFIFNKFLAINYAVGVISMFVGYLIFAIVLVLIRGLNQKEINNMQGTMSYFLYSFLSSLFHIR